MSRLSRLVLTDFRNYPRLVLTPEAERVVLAGPNGSGKTNILEAISLLAPGRGLRGAKPGALARHDGPGSWGIAARIGSGNAVAELGTGVPEANGRRRTLLDGREVRNSAETARRFACLWLTPQMDGLFQESASGRRRFLDRLVFTLEPGHARQAAAHDASLASRNKLLEAPAPDAAWLDAVEASLARHAVAVSAARRVVVARLNAAPVLGAFPRVALTLLDPIADRLASDSALAVEEWLRAGLRQSRGRDRGRGTSIGAHRADMTLADRDSGLAADAASTGQRRAMLTGLLLVHVRLLADQRGMSPVLLLDEPLVHLDELRRAALFDALRHLPGQVFFTGTDAPAFAALRGEAQFLRTGGNGLAPLAS